MKKNSLKWIVLVLCFVLFLFLATLVYKQNTFIIDTWGYSFAKFFRNDFVTVMVRWITNLGSSYILIFLSIFTIFCIKNKKIGYSLAIDLSVITGLNQILKHIFARPRPQSGLIHVGGYSFPSGHAMVSLAFYGLMIYFIYKSNHSAKVKWVSIIGLSVLILLIGMSRIYLGVHYTSDILGGFLVSILYLIVFTSLLEKTK